MDSEQVLDTVPTQHRILHQRHGETSKNELKMPEYDIIKPRLLWGTLPPFVLNSPYLGVSRRKSVWRNIMQLPKSLPSKTGRGGGAKYRFHSRSNVTEWVVRRPTLISSSIGRFRSVCRLAVRSISLRTEINFPGKLCAILHAKSQQVVTTFDYWPVGSPSLGHEITCVS